ncbi:hypothetical protein BH09MYX1_BH09MYX1_26340 [soil metagenome]
MKILRLLVCASLTLLPLAAACSSSTDDPTEDDTESSVDAITRGEIMTRAQQWVNLGVPYCGGVRGGTDYICGGTCYRPSAAWNNYRTDCSGYVSWAWQVTDDPSTYEYVNDRSGNNGWHTIPINSMTVGDAVVAKGHIKLFNKFVGSSSADIYEEYDCDKVARHTTQGFSRSGSFVYFNGDSRPYHAIRRNALTGASSPPIQPTSSCSVHSDGKLYCNNTRGAAMYSSASYGGSVVNHLRTSPSWFECWSTGQLHGGGNTTWYRTIGDDNGSRGFIPAVNLDTTSSFDANPSAHGLKHCQ